MNSGNEAFETLADRFQQHAFMNANSLYQRVDEYTFKQINKGPREIIYKMVEEKTTQFSRLISRIPVCVVIRMLPYMKEEIAVVLKKNQLYASIFVISEPNRIIWGNFYLNRLGFWEGINKEDECPEISLLSDAMLTDLCESKRYRLAQVTGILEIKKG